MAAGGAGAGLAAALVFAAVAAGRCVRGGGPGRAPPDRGGRLGRHGAAGRGSGRPDAAGD